jgi:hypothetical protein
VRQRGGSAAAGWRRIQRSNSAVAAWQRRQQGQQKQQRSSTAAALAPQLQPCSVGSGRSPVAAAQWWRQHGGIIGSSTAAGWRPWRQRRGRRRQLGDWAVLAKEEAWRVLQWQCCCGKCSNGSMAVVVAQWRRQCGGAGSLAAAAFWCWQCSSGGGSTAAASAWHQRSSSGCGRGPPFNSNNVTMKFG